MSGLVGELGLLGWWVGGLLGGFLLSVDWLVS